MTVQSDAGRYRQLAEQWAKTAGRRTDAALLERRSWTGVVEIRPVSSGLVRCLHCGSVHRIPRDAEDLALVMPCGRPLRIRSTIADSPTKQLRREG